MFGGKARGARKSLLFLTGVPMTKHVFFCFVVCGQIFAQEISPTAKEFYQIALGASEAEQKIRFLKKALEASPQYLEAKLELGKTFFQIGNYDQARIQLESALDIDSRNAEVWYWKGRAYQALGDTATAARSYRRALKWTPNLAEAKSALKKIENQPKLEALYQTAEQARQAKDWRLAAENYQEILDNKSNFKDAAQKFSLVQNKMAAEALAASAETLRRRQQFDEAMAKLNQAIAIDYDGAVEFQERIRQIARQKRAAEDKNKEQTVNRPTEVLKSPSHEDSTAVTATKDSSARAKAAISPKDSSTRPSQQTHAEKPQQNFSTPWLAAVGAIILIIIVAFIFWQKKRGKSQEASASQRPPAPIEILPSVPVVNNNAEKSSLFRRTSIKSTEASTPQLERYRLQEQLGRGGMGRVYKAYDLKLERPVAVKIIRLDNTVDSQEVEERIARFRREAKAIARLNHPNIVSLYDYDEADGMLYMIMEYVEGQSVEQMLNTKRQLGARLAVRMIKQVCWALDYAHKNGVIHRDIKPSNIMLNTEDVVKVVDFGVAKMLGASNTQMNTLTGMRLGSPFYMSPEQIEALAIDSRSDVYSLGVVFYEMLAGQKPFTMKEGNSLSSLFYAILHIDPPKLKTVSPHLEMIVQKMLAKDREQRFAKTREIIEALSALHLAV